MSLEQPNSPAIFLEQDMPSVEVEVDVKADRLAESVFEVVVSGTVTAKVKDKIAFLIEAKQAGIFDIRNIPDEQLDPLVGIACPTILFPYLRSNIADAITRAGFPPIHLAEINFQALYEQRLAQLQQQAGAAAGAPGTTLNDVSLGPVLGMKVAVLGAGAWARSRAIWPRGTIAAFVGARRRSSPAAGPARKFPLSGRHRAA